MPSKIDRTGQRFGRLVVRGEASPASNGRRRVRCTCDCGAEVLIEPRALTSSKGGKSCGCLQKDVVRRIVIETRTTHGGTGTAEYNIWRHMKGRCENKSNAKFASYGGRGIKVCERWQNDFEAFLSDMGPRPKGCSIDRIDTNGDYEPGNCRWATNLVQSRNKRNHRLVEYAGKMMPLSEACECANVNYRSALYRLNKGMHWMPLPTPPAGGSDAE